MTLSLPCVLLRAWQEDPGCFLNGARVGTEVEEIFTKNVVIGPFMIFVGMSFSQSNFLAIRAAGCDSNVNLIC